MKVAHYRVGPPDSTDLSKLGLREILIETREGEVCREIGINLDGAPKYKHPSTHNRASFRGLFDSQYVKDLIGVPISREEFMQCWNAASTLEDEGKLQSRG